MQDLMNSRFRNLGFGGSKRKSSSPNTIINSANNSTAIINQPSSNGIVHTPTGSTSSTTSLPTAMNHNRGGLGRPPSYTYDPSGPNAGRATSPLPPNSQAAMANPHHPAPINTGSYAHPAMGGAPQPPGYGYGAQGHGDLNAPLRYGRPPEPQELTDTGRSKAQLIVGIDFVGCKHSLPLSSI